MAYPYPHRPNGGKCDDPGPEPDCSDCPHGKVIKDPFGTGDHWHTEIECMARECPWGKE